MTYTDTWRRRLAKFLDGERGRKAELARWLADRIGGEVQSRKVQVSRVLGGTMPDAEFLLATDDFLRQKKLTDV